DPKVKPCSRAPAFQFPESCRRHLCVFLFRPTLCEFDIRVPSGDTHTRALPPACSDCSSCDCASHSCHQVWLGPPCRRPPFHSKRIPNPSADRFHQSSDCSWSPGWLPGCVAEPPSTKL